MSTPFFDSAYQTCQPRGLLAPGPPVTFCTDKKSPKNRRTNGPDPFIYLVFVYATTCLSRFSQFLPWADASRITGATPLPFGLLRWVRLLKHTSISILPGHRHGAGGTAHPFVGRDGSARRPIENLRAVPCGPRPLGRGIPALSDLLLT